MRLLLLTTILFIEFHSCFSQGQELPLFQLLQADKTGVDFANYITETDTFNIHKYVYAYNGGGVAVGDINSDGLPDIYLGGTQIPNKLYLNKGRMKFEDISEKAGVSRAAGITNGISMADVDGDGDLDMYVCKFNYPNILYINNGNNTFSDRASEFNLAVTGTSLQALFFDYDNDGDLDMYLVMNGPLRNEFRKPGDSDKLFRNNGNSTFTDVSDSAGIRDIGYGLSVSAGDLNGDGWIDLYITNDFEVRDILYYNNRNGTFRNATKDALSNTSLFGMGSDIADFNNDGLPDIAAMDMFPPNHKRKMTQLLSMSNYSSNLDSMQLMRNTLQLNRGNGTFSDICYVSGVAETDWSWACLFVDLDNDGFKDFYITNGIKRDMDDQDFNRAMKSPKPSLELLDKMPTTLLENYVFRNNRDLTFVPMNKQWGMNQKVNSNGAVFADLDNDGDLEIIINNIDSVAFIYNNLTSERKQGNYLRVRLIGNGHNTYGIGARVSIRQKNTNQMQDLMLTRGFLSSVEPIMHFGVGKDRVIEELTVRWASGKTQTLRNIPVNQLLTIRENK